MADPKLISEPPLLVLPSLATAIGLNEAIVLQQIHFKTRESDAFWWRASMPALRTEFPFWSEATIKRALARLRAQGLVKTRQSGTDRTNNYRVQYEALQRVNLAKNRPVASAQNAPIPISSLKRGTAQRGEASAAKFAHLDGGTRTA